MNFFTRFLDWILVDTSNLADSTEEMMTAEDWQKSNDGSLLASGLLLLALIIVFALTGCNALGTAASLTGEGCIKVKNYISKAYVVRSATGESVKPMEAQYQETNTHPVYTGGEDYAETDLSVMVVEKATNRTVNSHKEEVYFEVRQIGCPIVQISNPDEIRFDIE